MQRRLRRARLRAARRRDRRPRRAVGDRARVRLRRDRRRRAGGRRHLAARPALALLGRHDAHVRGRRRRAAGGAARVLAAARASRSSASTPTVRAGRRRPRRCSTRSCEPYSRRGQPTQLHQGRRAAAARGRLLPRASATASGSRSTSARASAGSATTLIAGDVDRRSSPAATAGLRRRAGWRTSCVVTEDGCEILTDFPYDLCETSEPLLAWPRDADAPAPALRARSARSTTSATTC